MSLERTLRKVLKEDSRLCIGPECRNQKSIPTPTQFTLLSSFRMRNEYNRCASCLGESARAQWFRHSDGWRSGSSTMGSATSGLSVSNYHSDHSRSKRSSAWDSLPSLRNENSLNDSGYKSVRTNSLEQRWAERVHPEREKKKHCQRWTHSFHSSSIEEIKDYWKKY